MTRLAVTGGFFRLLKGVAQGERESVKDLELVERAKVSQHLIQLFSVLQKLQARFGKSQESRQGFKSTITSPIMARIIPDQPISILAEHRRYYQ